MPASKGFHDLLFEASNESRYEILVLLREKPMRNTEISNILHLTTTEIRRQVSRLRDVGLIQRDVEGFYHLTPYGEISLIMFQEFHFLSSNKEYFQTHTTGQIPTEIVKRMGDLIKSTNIENAIDFFRFIETIFKESKEYVWLLVDQFPLNSLSTIIETIDRGIQFKIIEPVDRIHSPNIDSMTSEETQALNRTRYTPLVEQRTLDEVNICLFFSEKKCVLAFPTTDGEYDYKGFTASDQSSLKWCKDLFQYYWDKGEHSRFSKPDKHPLVERASEDQIIVDGRNDPNIDTQAIQDAVDNFDEVVLRGRFNLDSGRMRAAQTGTTSIKIRRDENIPRTKMVKSNWKFPLLEFDNLLEVDGDGIDVTIENIHFQDFNSFCITASQGNSVKICNNRITLASGLGRGHTYGDMGDHVAGIQVWSGYKVGSFPGGAIIEGNYLDFALEYTIGGFIPRKKVLDPNYRPDHANHESYLGFGVLVNWNLGKVIIRNNVIRNMNAKGIVIQDNFESAEIHITGNTIVSEIFGSYPFSTHFAGYGIQVLSSWGGSRALSGARVEISSNKIRCDKLNYCGIGVYGLSMYREGAGKLGECNVYDNTIRLEDGSVGLLVRKNDETEVYGNKFSGRAYYGIHLWGSKDREGFDLGSNRNQIVDNDMTNLVIKPPNKYSDSHVDGRMFTGSEGKSETANVWLNKFTRNNVVKVQENETVIDEGERNQITNN